MESNVLLKRIVDLLESKKARDISVIDIKEITILADYFVICSGMSTTHIRAIADELGIKMNETGRRYLHIEGYSSARWILMDYGDVVVHIFHEEERSFYNLERLWHDGIISYR